MRKNCSSRQILSVIVLSLLMAFAAVPGLAQGQSDKSLYERVGGYNALAAVVETLLAGFCLMTDFRNSSPDIARIRKSGFASTSSTSFVPLPVAPVSTPAVT